MNKDGSKSDTGVIVAERWNEIEDRQRWMRGKQQCGAIAWQRAASTSSAVCSHRRVDALLGQ